MCSPLGRRGHAEPRAVRSRGVRRRGGTPARRSSIEAAGCVSRRGSHYRGPTDRRSGPRAERARARPRCRTLPVGMRTAAHLGAARVAARPCPPQTTMPARRTADGHRVALVRRRSREVSDADPGAR
ncbi:hypothetical protein Rrhod_1536 [Rhodococcus rhodnii LMG 5362]|uniref:Uncharacterized protein n=1 Tax=Rhodococcus rhodnii LMG 5362 TaxID=1273125 RepID=R7WSN0_9NOCA|nr:hypothetical protein Rrhod_1536 [Rhodococcus rhodnii LMG 5362]